MNSREEVEAARERLRDARHTAWIAPKNAKIIDAHIEALEAALRAIIEGYDAGPEMCLDCGGFGTNGVDRTGRPYSCERCGGDEDHRGRGYEPNDAMGTGIESARALLPEGDGKGARE